MTLFTIYLLCAIWQDISRRSLDIRFLIGFGLVGFINGWMRETNWAMVCISVSSGTGLLILSRLTGGSLGEGDGWFFMVSGLFLGPKENTVLLLSGLVLCGIFSLLMIAAGFAGRREVRKMRIPFLPFLLPGGLWLAFL